jgi:hypothetical protein
MSETAETLAKHQKKLESMWVVIAQHCNIQMKTIATYVWKHLKHLHIYATFRSTFATFK